MFVKGQFKELMLWEDVINRDLTFQNKHLANRIEKYIETDPEGRLQKCHPEGYPQANCQAYAIRRFIKQPKDTLKVLIEDWKIPEGTLQAFVGRKKYRKLLREIITEEEIKYNLSPKLMDYLRQDKSNQLKECYPNRHIQCNAHGLAIDRLLSDPPIRFEALAQQWKVSENIVNKHWRDTCFPLLESIINTQEYL